MKKVITNIAFLLIIGIGAIACKKDKNPAESPKNCLVTDIYVESFDTFNITYSSSNKQNSIRQFRGDDSLFTMYFSHNPTYIENNIYSSTSYLGSVRYETNSEGNIIKFYENRDIDAIEMFLYYNSNNQLKHYNAIFYRSGVPHTYTKDSLIYENDNLVRWYSFTRNATEPNFRLFSADTILYATSLNAIGLFANFIVFDEKPNFFNHRFTNSSFAPYVLNFLGKGSKNLPLQLRRTSDYGVIRTARYEFENILDASKNLTQQNISLAYNGSPLLFDKTIKFNLKCN